MSVSSCEKDEFSTCSVLVRVKHNGKQIEQPSIYLSNDSTISETKYDRLTGGDAIGEAYFDHLKLGSYYFYAKAYSGEDKKSVNGTAMKALTEQGRNYTVIIETN
jgi:hypothetical protein